MYLPSIYKSNAFLFVNSINSFKEILNSFSLFFSFATLDGKETTVLTMSAVFLFQGILRLVPAANVRPSGDHVSNKGVTLFRFSLALLFENSLEGLL